MTLGRWDPSAEHIAPPFRIEPPRGGMTVPLRELLASRELLYILLLRDVRLRYKQTALGVLWVILQPLLASLIFAIIFGRFAKLPSEGVPYLPFVFAGMLPWLLLAGALLRAGGSLISDARLISKVYFPRMTIPLASAGSVLVDFAVALAVMFGIMAFADVAFTVRLLLIPALLLLAFALAVGIGLFFSALNVYYRDFTYVLPFLVQIWMYASPVVYSVSLVPEALRPMYSMNPAVGLIEAFRWALLGSADFPMQPLAVTAVVAVCVLWGGAMVFQRVERNFADVI